MKHEGGSLELSVINPMAIYGPALNGTLSSGYGLLLNILNGKMKSIPDIRLGIVDVRDVADLHILAMTNPAAKGQRFLALSGGTMSLLEISRFLKKEKPEITGKASVKPMPTCLLWVASLFNKQAKAILPLVGINRNASNEKARTLLGWNPHTNEEAILATVESLIKFGYLQ
jgi:nucleoside-diphosphate-sugar epimerase